MTDEQTFENDGYPPGYEPYVSKDGTRFGWIYKLSGGQFGVYDARSAEAGRLDAWDHHRNPPRRCQQTPGFRWGLGGMP